MSLQDRIETLRAKHAELEAAIRHEIARPLPDDRRLTDLKRHKLHIKDTIAELCQRPHRHTDGPGALVRNDRLQSETATGHLR